MSMADMCRPDVLTQTVLKCCLVHLPMQLANDDVVFGKSVFCQHLNVTKCCDLNLEKLFHGYCTLGALSQLQMGYIRTEKCNIVSSEMHQILNMSCSTESAHSLICCVPYCTKEVKC